VVKQGGFEPPTRGFSIRCSTPELLFRTDDLTMPERLGVVNKKNENSDKKQHVRCKIKDTSRRSRERRVLVIFNGDQTGSIVVASEAFLGVLSFVRRHEKTRGPCRSNRSRGFGFGADDGLF
jgi:hypothetical protein